ncbi:hypothetical protein HPB49_013606 [Dermacentor silvarum]|uniref:Uncharacterized protein n=2 Tax=Dermacentor silvarum TaxID=543639 RepID=A0ACB8D5Z8_DERSI|nr:hypothetical protein HPB49_013606 [Dermacentor silvarum]
MPLTTMQRRRPAFQTIDGVPRCIDVDPDNFRENLKFRAKEGDIVQCTFPKSGTNWIQYITQLILRPGESINDYREFCDGWRFIDYMNIKNWKSPYPLRCFSTHMPLSRERVSEQGKYVYLARNPWDVCVSFYNMATRISYYNFQDGTFEELVDAFLGGNFGYGDYFEHVAAGYELRNERNVLFLTYEELKNNTREVVLKLAYFMGECYGRALEQDEEMLQKLLQRSTPEHMRSVVVVDLGSDWHPELRLSPLRGNVTCMEGYGGNKSQFAYVRSAKVGSWKDFFTPELLRRMEARILVLEKTSSFMDLWVDFRAEALRLSSNSS